MSVEQWIGVVLILVGFGWGFYLVLHPELSLINVQASPITFETTNGGTHGDLKRRIAAASACVWCSAGPREAHTENCPYVP